MPVVCHLCRTGTSKYMRRLVLALAVAAVGGTAACTTAGPGGATPTPTPTTAAVTCPTGSWRSSSVSATTTTGGLTITMDGGADVMLTVAADGTVTANFTGMKPIVYSTQVGGAPVKGEFTYDGTAKANLNAPTATGTATGTATSTTATPTATGSTPAGTPWHPGQADFSTLQLTVKLTAPIALTVIDKAKVSDVTDAQATQAGNVVDLRPLLRAGTYRCDGNDKLIVTPSGSGGPTVAWTMARTAA
jgi:hypothetical protein